VRVVVIGDAIVDEIVELAPLKRSAEGIPSHIEVSRRLLCGGSANVAKHLVRLGATVSLIHGGPPLSFSDDGLSSQEMLRLWQSSSPYTVHTRKLRYYSDGQKVLKVNYEGTLAHMYDDLRKTLDRYECTAVVACDNSGGLSWQQEGIVDLVTRRGRKLIVDLQGSQLEPRFHEWVGADELMLNSTERDLIDDETLAGFGRYHVKLGADGSLLCDGVTQSRQWGFPVDVVDTVGAGDAYLAAWVRTGDLALANLWAALSCTKIGTGLPTREDLDAYDDETAARLRQYL
jgi:bifunctional ADP-heptose synthase (sugar kinase/adenylyltransferase)